MAIRLKAGFTIPNINADCLRLPGGERLLSANFVEFRGIPQGIVTNGNYLESS